MLCSWVACWLQRPSCNWMIQVQTICSIIWTFSGTDNVSSLEYLQYFHLKDYSQQHCKSDVAMKGVAMRSVVPLLCFISSITKRLSHKLSHPLKGQGASVFLYLLPPFSFQLVPHSSNGEFPRGTGVLLSPFPSIYPSLAPRDRCGVYWPCSDLLTWGGGALPILLFLHL